MAGTQVCRTCRAMLTEADAAKSPGVCPYCGSETDSSPESRNPYAPPRTKVGEESVIQGEITKVPPSFRGKLSLALRLFFGNIILISALFLTVWLPGNLLLILVALNNLDPGPDRVFIVAQLANLIEFVFAPVYIGGVLYILANRMTGQTSSYSGAIQVSMHNWWRLFGARFVASLFTTVGFIAFLVPGIILAIRYALLDPVVVLEGAGPTESRTRSTELSRGRELEIFVAGVVYSCFLIWCWIALIGILEYAMGLDTTWIALVFLSMTNIIKLFATCFWFTLFWEGHVRRPVFFGIAPDRSGKHDVSDAQ